MDEFTALNGCISFWLDNSAYHMTFLVGDAIGVKLLDGSNEISTFAHDGNICLAIVQGTGVSDWSNAYNL